MDNGVTLWGQLEDDGNILESGKERNGLKEYLMLKNNL